MAWQLLLSSMLYTLIMHALSSNNSTRYIRTFLLIMIKRGPIWCFWKDEMCYWTKSHTEPAIKSVNWGFFHLIILLIIFGLVFPLKYGKYFPPFFLGKFIGILVEKRHRYTPGRWSCGTCCVRKLTSLNIYWEARLLFFFSYLLSMVTLNVTSKWFDYKASFPVWRIKSRADVSATVLIVFCLFIFCFVFPFFWINVSFCGEQKILCGEQSSCLFLIRDENIKC